MADPKNIGDDVAKSLRAAVSVVGPVAMGDLGSINQGISNLQVSLRSYDRHANELSYSAPTAQERKEDLNNWIKKRYPQGKGYTDKRYKMMFMRTLYRIPHLLRNRDQSKERQIESSLQVLTIFKLLYNLVIANSKRLVQVAGGATQQAAQQKEDLQPEEFDPEQSSVTEELERELQPPRATDKDLKQTETNVDRRTRRVEQTGKVESEDEYRTMVAKQSQVVEDARTSVRKHRDEIKKSLSLADARTFRLITNSTRAANDLAKAYMNAASAARAELAPGSYTACKAFADFLAELTRIVIDSSSTNRQQRNQMRKRQKAYDKYLSTTEVNEPQEG